MAHARLRVPARPNSPVLAPPSRRVRSRALGGSLFEPRIGARPEAQKIAAAVRAPVAVRPEGRTKIPPKRLMIVSMVPAGELHAQALGTFGVNQLGEQPNACPDAPVAVETPERILAGGHAEQVQKRLPPRAPEIAAAAAFANEQRSLHRDAVSLPWACTPIYSARYLRKACCKRNNFGWV